MSRKIEKLHDQLAWQSLTEHATWLLETAQQIQAIPAPTFDESARADFVKAAMHSLDLRNIEIDPLFNVYGLMQGRHPNAPHVVLTAHTDTVFAGDTDLTAHRAPGMITAPGIGDNSVGVASILAFARFLRAHRITPAVNLWFVATSREEGLGDLGGMKAAFARLANGIGGVINIEGLALGHVYNAGIAVRRLQITAHAEGGHSWLHFGRPSAIHALMMVGTKICAIRPPEAPRTTYNIGMIRGGTTINSIAPKAEFWLDLRSETTEQLSQLEAQVHDIVAAFGTEALSFTTEIVGDRPAGSISERHPLVEHAMDTLRVLGISPTLETGSTDANIPLSQGCPAVTIGVTRGGNAHRIDEFIETEPIHLGLKQLILLTLTYAQHIAGLG